MRTINLELTIGLLEVTAILALAASETIQNGLAIAAIGAVTIIYQTLKPSTKTKE